MAMVVVVVPVSVAEPTLDSRADEHTKLGVMRIAASLPCERIVEAVENSDHPGRPR